MDRALDSRRLVLVTLLGSYALALPVLLGEPQPTRGASIDLQRVRVNDPSLVPEALELGDTWSVDTTKSVEWDRALDQGVVDLVGAVQGGDWQMVELLSDLQDPAFVSASRLACAEQYAGDVKDACSYRIEMIVERRNDRSGEIVYVRSLEHDFHLDGTAEDPGCSDYVKCLAGIRLGETVAMPANANRAAVAQELYSPWVDKRLYDPSFVRELASDYRQQVEALGEEPEFDRPMAKADYLLAIDLARYLEAFAARLEAGDGQ